MKIITFAVQKERQYVLGMVTVSVCRLDIIAHVVKDGVSLVPVVKKGHVHMTVDVFVVRKMLTLDVMRMDVLLARQEKLFVRVNMEHVVV